MKVRAPLNLVACSEAPEPVASSTAQISQTSINSLHFSKSSYCVFGSGKGGQFVIYAGRERCSRKRDKSRARKVRKDGGAGMHCCTACCCCRVKVTVPVIVHLA